MRLNIKDVPYGMYAGAQDIIDNIIIEEGARYIQVHPTFLYESAWNLMTVALLFVFCKRRKFDGQIAAMYLLLYGIGRFFIEGLRTDSLYLFGTVIRVSQAVSVVAAVGAAGFIGYNIFKLIHKGKGAVIDEDQ
jgi:phosphatidylglycerol:prolipoprotein diacylglycerol transferase